jgi:HEAT repeat protein
MAAEMRQPLIARLQSERDPEVLGRYVHDRAWQVRWAAIQSLGKSESLDAEAPLLEVLAENEPNDLPFANTALGRVGSKAAIAALTGLIHHPIEDVKASAIRALESLGDASLTPTFLDALSDRSWVAKWYAMAAIAAHADERAIDAVNERLRASLRRDRKTSVAGMTEVMYALTYLGRWRPTHPDADEAIRWVREEAIGRLHPNERTWFDATFAE